MAIFHLITETRAASPPVSISPSCAVALLFLFGSKGWAGPHPQGLPETIAADRT
jgi:hypothetical protein